MIYFDIILTNNDKYVIKNNSILKITNDINFVSNNCKY